MIHVTARPDGCVVPVKAQPGARRTGVVGEHAGALKLAVAAPPEKGRANQALVELLSDLLGVKCRQVQLVAGKTSADKKFLILGLSAPDVSRRIEALVGGGT
jgi:hypothetical protein